MVTVLVVVTVREGVVVLTGLVVPLEGVTTVRVTVPLGLASAALGVLVAGAVVVVVGRAVVPLLLVVVAEGRVMTLEEEGFSEEISSLLPVAVGFTFISERAEVVVEALMLLEVLPVPVAPLAMAS